VKRVFFAAAVLLVALGACRKPKPSPEFNEAQGKYSSLVAELGDSAFSDDRMTAVEELLAKVPRDSLDAIAAAELQQKINAERKRITEEAAAHEKAMANALAPPNVDWPRTPEATKEEPVAVPDAGPAELAVGISVDEMRKQSGDCFNSAGSLKLRRSAVDEMAEMWERREVAGCPQKYPQYSGKILVFVGGKLAGSYDRAALKQETPPDQAKPPQPAPVPGKTVVTYPGAPEPGAPVPSPGENTGPGPTEPTPQ